MEERLERVVVGRERRECLVEDILREDPSRKEVILQRIEKGISPEGPREERRHLPALREKLIKRALETEDVFVLGIIFKNFFSTTPILTEAWRRLVFELTGRSKDLAFNLARVVIRILAYRTDYHDEELYSRYSFTDFQNYSVYLAFLPVCAMLGQAGALEKEWLHRIIEAGQEGEEEAGRLIWGLLDFVFKKVRLFSLTDYSESMRSYSQSEIGQLIQKINQEPDQVEIPWYLPGELMPWLNGFLKTQYARDSERIKEIESEIEWWLSNRERLKVLSDERVAEIKANHRYALRSNGADWLKIKIASLNHHGLDQLRFVQEGYQPPDLGLVFPMIVCGQVKKIRVPLTDFKLKIEELEFHFHGEILTEMLYVVAVSGLHAILVGNGEEVVIGGENGNKNKFRFDKPSTQSHKVRPHLRLLPEGFRASEGARQAAQDLFGQLPEGKTFVREYEKLAEDLQGQSQTEPFATVSLDRLF